MTIKKIKKKYEDRWEMAAWDYQCWFRNITIDLLKLLKSEGCSCFNVPVESEHYDDLIKVYGNYFNGEQTSAIYETMIYHLKMTDENYVEKVLYGKNIEDDDYVFDYFNKDKWNHISNICVQNKDSFMKLFNLFFFQLWD